MLRLNGIGHTFAQRIVEYRTRLGGFSSYLQLKEVYGISDSTVYNVTPYLSLSPIFRKLQINKSGKDDLKHPYLTYKQVDVMVRYRINHGNFKNIDDVRRVGVFNEAQLDKIKPYLDFAD